MPRVSVGKVADLPQGKLVGADIDSEKILVANVGGSFHAMRSTCNHAGGPLHQGKLPVYKVLVEGDEVFVEK